MVLLRGFRPRISALSIFVTPIWLLAARPANTQSLYATVVGTVTDQSGAAIPDAKIEATQTETNEKRTAATNESGFYALSTLPSGTYVLSISKLGFAVFERKGGALFEHICGRRL